MELNFKLIEDAIPLLLAGAGITLEITRHERRLWLIDRYDYRRGKACQH